MTGLAGAGARGASDTPSLAARADQALGRVPVYPLLFAAYPVLRLYADNVAEVAFADVFPPLVAVVGLTAAGLALLSWRWRESRRSAIVMTAITLPFLVFGYVADAIWPVFPHYPMDRVYAILIWAAVVIVSIYVAVRIGARLRAVTLLLNVVSVTLIILVAVSLASHALQMIGVAAQPTTTLSLVSTDGEIQDLGPRRDIYHFVFDRYGSEASLSAGKGIDNSDFVAWLKESGFSVVDNARANHERTLLSLASVLSMDDLDGLAATMGPDNPDLGPLFERLRNNPVATVLQDHGYRYIHVGSWFSPTARSSVADEVIRPVYDVSFISTLRDQSAIGGFGELATIVSTLSLDGNIDQRAEATSVQFERLPRIAEEPGPKLVFVHALVPHEPYLFLADGTVDAEHATYETQLQFANAQIRSFVEPLLKLPEDEQPIIILQADEGPYPERYEKSRDEFDWSAASDEELVAKFGVLNAMYLPGPEGREPLPDGMTLVNTYPEVLGRYLGLEVPREPDRSFAIRHGMHYDWTDITQRLDDAYQAVSASDDQD